MTTFELFKRNNGRFYYRIISDTGHNIMASDGYQRKRDCKAAIEQVKNFINNTSCIQVEETGTRQFKFTLTGTDNSIIGYSMSFNSKDQCVKWIKLMQKYIPESAIIEANNGH